MDLLHYRRTGDFANYLLNNAATPTQMSYARGYLTHVAGDISGHPFINRLVFGPFRSHAYRHLVLETMADTWLWDRAGRGDILDAHLDEAISVDDDELNEIIDLLLDAMKAVYVPPMVPSLLKQGYPERGEIAFAYRLLKRYLKLSTERSVKRPSPPPDSIQAVWDEIKTLLQNNMPGPLPQWNGDVVDFLTALFTWFAKGIVLLVMIATLPAAALSRIVMLAPRWAIYLINLGVYFLVSAIRTMLCLTGWGYMGREDFGNFGFLEGLITTGPFENSTYPAKTVPVPKPPFYWLAFPRWPYDVERPSTMPMLPSSSNLQPDWMINPRNVMDPSTRAALVSLDSAVAPAETENILNSLQGSDGFGNAVDFSIALLDKRFPIPI